MVVVGKYCTNISPFGKKRHSQSANKQDVPKQVHTNALTTAGHQNSASILPLKDYVRFPSQVSHFTAFDCARENESWVARTDASLVALWHTAMYNNNSGEVIDCTNDCGKRVKPAHRLTITVNDSSSLANCPIALKDSANCHGPASTHFRTGKSITRITDYRKSVLCITITALLEDLQCSLFLL